MPNKERSLEQTITRESWRMKNLYPLHSLSEVMPQQKPLVTLQPAQPETDLISVHTDSDRADSGTRETPQAEYTDRSSDHERTSRVAGISLDPLLETIGIPIVKSPAVSMNRNSEMQNQKVTDYFHTLSEVSESMKAIPKITNIEVMKSPKFKFQNSEITIISGMENSKFTGDSAEDSRVKNQDYWLNSSMHNSDGNGVSGIVGPIKLPYNVPCEQRENEQHKWQAKNDRKNQRQSDNIEPQIELRGDESTISVRDDGTI
ncbi:hypothetical protein QAD02_021053 [Eretmocerus hayati]|uniref:Uncharacterized protein n=1 Tax=Eretmocerus hayati TaxID=131215 RepID=A0ACC2PTY8_9HYME|nr:hypothetical protein QAD02_021053 [Eretmocerus hayati]